MLASGAAPGKTSSRLRPSRAASRGSTLPSSVVTDALRVAQLPAGQSMGRDADRMSTPLTWLPGAAYEAAMHAISEFQ